jgi:carboxylesterase
MTYLDPLAESFHLEGSNGQGVLVVHGIGGTPAHLRMLAQHLNTAGCTVHGPLLEGHGTSLEHMEQTDRSDWLETARQGYHRLAEECDRVHLFGFSMGGLLSLKLAADLPVASLTTLNTPVKLHDRRQPIARILQYFQRFHMWEGDELEPEGEAARYWVGYEGIPVKGGVQLLDLIRETKARMSDVTVPLLVIQSRVDETVRPVSAEIIIEKTSSFRKELLWLERSRHNSLLYDERNLIHDRVLEHLRRS